MSLIIEMQNDILPTVQSSPEDPILNRKKVTTVATGCLTVVRAPVASPADLVRRIEKEQQKHGKLMRAVSISNIPEITALLTALSSTDRLEILGRTDREGNTALSLAILNNNIPVIIALLTTLPEVADRLLALGQQNGEGLTALTAAITNNNNDAIKALLRSLPKAIDKLRALEQRDSTGLTPFTLAVSHATIVVLRTLLAALPSEDDKQMALRQCDNQGKTPLDLLLEQSGPDHDLKLELLALHNAPYSGSLSLPLSRKQQKELVTLQWRLEELVGGMSHIAYESLSQTLLLMGDRSASFLAARAAFVRTIDYQLMSAIRVAQHILDGNIVVIPTG